MKKIKLFLEGYKGAQWGAGFEHYKWDEYHEDIYNEGHKIPWRPPLWLFLFIEGIKAGIWALKADNCDHNYEIHDDGDAENGPKTYGVCTKCNYQTEYSYHG